MVEEGQEAVIKAVHIQHAHWFGVQSLQLTGKR